MKFYPMTEVGERERAKDEDEESPVDSLVMPGEAARQAIIKHLSDELDFAERIGGKQNEISARGRDH